MGATFSCESRRGRAGPGEAARVTRTPQDEMTRCAAPAFSGPWPLAQECFLQFLESGKWWKLWGAEGRRGYFFWRGKPLFLPKRWVTLTSCQRRSIYFDHVWIKIRVSVCFFSIFFWGLLYTVPVDTEVTHDKVYPANPASVQEGFPSRRPWLLLMVHWEPGLICSLWPSFGALDPQPWGRKSWWTFRSISFGPYLRGKSESHVHDMG